MSMKAAPTLAVPLGTGSVPRVRGHIDMLEVWKENRDEAAISAEKVLSEVPAEEAEKAKDLRRRRMAAVGPYVMPEVRRGQG